MKILVCGGRWWKDEEKIRLELTKYPAGTILVEGGCKGADLMSAKIAKELGFEIREYPAQWAKYGKSAGPKRNRQMVTCENPDINGVKIDLVIAFHENIEESKGTKDMISVAEFNEIPYILIK